MKVRFSEATDDRKLIHVETSVYGPEANLPTVLVTFEMFIPSDYSVKNGIQALVHLSTVRSDTYETYPLARDQMREVLETASRSVAEFDPDW